MRFADVDLNEDDSGNDAPENEDDSEEDEDEEEEGNPDEFVDVLDILDGKAEADNGSDDMDQTPGRHNSSGSEEESEDEQQPIPSDDEENPEALDHLDAFISNLETAAKRKAPDEEESNAPVGVKKRKLLKERTEAGRENEFATGQRSGTSSTACCGST